MPRSSTLLASTVSAGRRIWPWIGAWALIFALHTCVPSVTWDEAWFARVTQRIAHEGAVPYRDVFYIATPLSLWIGVVCSWLFGAQLLVLRAVAAVYAVATAGAGWSVTGRLGLGRLGRFAVVAALLGLGSGLGWPPAHYTALAIAFAAWTFDRAVAIVQANTDDDVRREFVVAAALVALTVCSKQTLGLYVAPMPIVAVLTRRPALGECLRLLRRGALVGVSIGAAVMAPVVVTGGLGQFVDQTVLAQGEYVEVSGIPWSDGVNQFGRDFSHVLDVGRWPFIVQGFAFVIPVVAVAVVAAAFVLGDRRGRVTASLAMIAAVAITANAFPRADGTHVIAGSVGSILAIGACAAGLRPRVPWSAVRYAVATLGLVVLPVLAVNAGSQAGIGERGLPHARGVGVPLRAGERDAMSTLRGVTNGEVFVLSPDASRIYLFGGIRNPTRYDFPLRGAFGVDGERDLIAAVRAGSLPVCVGFSYGPPLAPADLDAAVASSLVPRRDVEPVCVLYAAPSDG
ncbi:MAG: hypothetical protein QOH79_2202 [Acidimicrobiaceae bacterium]